MVYKQRAYLLVLLNKKNKNSYLLFCFYPFDLSFTDKEFLTATYFSIEVSGEIGKSKQYKTLPVLFQKTCINVYSYYVEYIWNERIYSFYVTCSKRPNVPYYFYKNH